MTGFLLFGSFIVLLILGVPIAVSLAMATMSAIIFSPDITLTLASLHREFSADLIPPP